MQPMTRVPAWLRTAALMPALTLAGGACDPAPSPLPNGSGSPAATASADASFTTATCPSDVVEATVVQLECATLTVLEKREAPSGRRIPLLVVKVAPRGGTPQPDPMVVIVDIRTGEFPDYGGLVEIANRVNRVVYILDPRGRAHSQPNLACPEVVAASPALAGLRWRDARFGEALRTAVTACRNRLVAEAVDPAAYGYDALAGDFEDLLTALGVREWNAIAYGPASQLALELARRNFGGLRSVTIDSPTLPDRAWSAQGPAAFDLAIERLGAMCAAEAACADVAPELAARVAEAIVRLDGSPLGFEVEGTPEAILLGHPIEVTLDGAALLRWIRAQVGQQRPTARNIVATVGHVLAGDLAANDPVVIALSSDVGGCLGTLPRCEFDIAWGTIYAATCGRSMSDAAVAKLDAQLAGRAAFADVFRPGMFGPACEAWGVAARPGPGVGSGLGAAPILLFRGELDPFSATPEEIAAATGASRVQLVEVPNGSSNVLGGFECVRSIRNAWVDDPGAALPDTSCLASIPAVDLPE